MSDDGAPRKMRLIAVGAALVALVLTLVAVIVVITRDGPPVAVKVEPPFVDHVVTATDVVRLGGNVVDVVVEQGTTKGLRVTDAELGKALGLVDGDVISALSGKLLTRDTDIGEVMLKMSLMSATTLYVEVTRKGKPVLLRWRLDGDLRSARYASRTPDSSVIDPFARPRLPSLAAPVPDPLLDTIVKVDDNHVRVPRKTVDTLLADPTVLTTGARVVPAVRNGRADGFKLYAIRPSSAYARLGLANGDTIHSIAGVELTSADKALEAFTIIKNGSYLEVYFKLTRRGQPVDLLVEITR